MPKQNKMLFLLKKLKQFLASRHVHQDYKRHFLGQTENIIGRKFGFNLRNGKSLKEQTEDEYFMVK